MKRFCCFIVVLLLPVVALADRPIILVTPAGVYQSISRDGVPGAWQPLAADVVVQGFGGDDPKPPEPPNNDPIVQQVADISKSLKDRDEATAVSALVDALYRNGLRGSDFADALKMAGRITDTSLNAAGRIETWVTKALAISDDATKLKAGLVKAGNLNAGTLAAIQQALASPGQPLNAEAANFAEIIAIIRMVIELL